jgi:AraC-like DNA-binding protein
VLKKRRLLDTPDLAIDDVRCASHRSGWSEAEVGWGHGVVFVRRGCFRRMVDGTEEVLDATTVYFERPGQEQRIAHPAEGGDACTGLRLSEDLVASLCGGEPGLPGRVVHTSPSVDLAARRVFASARRESDAFAPAEGAIVLLASVLAEEVPRRVRASRPATGRARKRLVDDAREVIADDPTIGLVELARRIGSSPHHLSRVFHAEVGRTLTSYRNRLRVRLALDRIAAGERSLSTVAADLGFADEAHLARTVRRETGRPPSHLRTELLSA